MAVERTHTITTLIEQVLSPDLDTSSKARDTIHEIYAEQLFEHARRQLNHRIILRGTEPQAVADSALMAFFKKPRPQVANRDSLLGFLVTVVVRKCKSAHRFHTAGIRNVRKEEGLGSDADEHHVSLGQEIPARAPESPKRAYERNVPTDGVQRESADFFDDEILQLMADGATPDQGAMLNEMIESLPSNYQDLVIWKLQGRSTREIAAQLNVSVNRVEQSLKSIESQWTI